MQTHHRWYISLGLVIALVLSAGIGISLYFLMQIERNLNATAQASTRTFAMVDAALKGTHKNGDDGYLVLSQRLLQNSTAAMNAFKQTMQDANTIAKAQAKPANDLAAQSIALVASGKTAVDSLNGVILDIRGQTVPSINASINSLNSATVAVEALVENMQPTATALGETVKSVNLAVTHADALIADPDFQKIAGNLNAMSASLADASAHVDKGAAHAESALNYVELDLTPTKQPFWRAILSEALSQAVGIPLKYFPTRTAVVSSVPVTTVPK